MKIKALKMNELVFIEVLDNLAVVEDQDVARERRRLRANIFNPLELSDFQFIQMFRLNKDLFDYLKNMIEPYMRPQLRNTDLSISTRIYTALRFYATGSYQMDIGHNQYIGVSQPSVSRSVGEVTDAINTPEVFNRWIKFPRNLEELNACRLRFFQKFNFPGVIGCIDCTHVAIFPPNIEHPQYPEYVYINRKGFHSINVQIITDADMRIININARYPGSTNDAFIWQNSNSHNAMRT
ncbi:putative nuclease HARBI1 [Photinus pyralis]|uniref:putative nuclease HARBI1 n=1 Tax=Photinus pyralis TaxID=7054 RepID=UPI001267302F|nr:putative nuclease HARBI1 [Photinus pyralis]